MVVSFQNNGECVKRRRYDDDEDGDDDDDDANGDQEHFNHYSPGHIAIRCVALCSSKGPDIITISS